MIQIRTALILTATILALSPAATFSKKKQTLQSLSAEILHTIQSFYPVRSTEMGIHAYDHRLADYSSPSVKKMIKSLNAYEKSLYKFKKANLSPHDRINYKLIKSNVDIALLDLKRIAWHKKSPQLYVDEAVNGLYFLLLSGHATEKEKVVSIINRMKAVPDLFATARKNLKQPPGILIEAALESLGSATVFYKGVAADLMNKFPDRADNILKVSTAAREAMNDFSIHLAELPTDSQTGFAIGKDNFDYKLSNEFFLTFDSDSLLKIGESLLAEAQQAYEKYEEYVDNNHQNGQDSVFVPSGFNRDDILEYYSWETRQVRVFLETHDLVTIPEAISPVSVIETPPFLRSMVPGIAYQPAGPFDSIQHGYFYVRPIPEDLDQSQLAGRYRYVNRRGFKGSVVHEAYPGHHLQMQLAGMSTDPVRKWQTNNMMVEGWALYCEEMIYHAGLFGAEDPAQWLGILGGIRFRAARIVSDVKLHTGQFTYDQCVAWMNDVLEISTDSGREYIRKEVRKQTMTPTNRMSYLMGKLEIMNLRRAAEERDGDAFSLRNFHDTLLSEGSIPPALIWEIMGLSPN